MIIGICKETFPGERRVALIPDAARRLTKLGLDVLVECGAERGVEPRRKDHAPKI